MVLCCLMPYSYPIKQPQLLSSFLGLCQLFFKFWSFTRSAVSTSVVFSAEPIGSSNTLAASALSLGNASSLIYVLEEYLAWAEQSFKNDKDWAAKRVNIMGQFAAQAFWCMLICNHYLAFCIFKENQILENRFLKETVEFWESCFCDGWCGWRYIEGVHRGSNTQVYSTAIKFKIGYVSFSTCSHEKFKPEMYKIVLNKGALRSCGSFLILFWVFCGCHKITTVIYFFWTIFTGFLPVS